MKYGKSVATASLYAPLRDANPLLHFFAVRVFNTI